MRWWGRSGSVADRPKCYCGCGRVIRSYLRKHGRRFATKTCAADHCEELIKSNDDAWCETCGAWKGEHDCD